MGYSLPLLDEKKKKNAACWVEWLNQNISCLPKAYHCVFICVLPVKLEWVSTNAWFYYKNICIGISFLLKANKAIIHTAVLCVCICASSTIIWISSVIRISIISSHCRIIRTCVLSILYKKWLELIMLYMFYPAHSSCLEFGDKARSFLQITCLFILCVFVCLFFNSPVCSLASNLVRRSSPLGRYWFIVFGDERWFNLVYPEWIYHLIIVQKYSACSNGELRCWSFSI